MRYRKKPHTESRVRSGSVALGAGVLPLVHRADRQCGGIPVQGHIGGIAAGDTSAATYLCKDAVGTLSAGTHKCSGSTSKGTQCADIALQREIIVMADLKGYQCEGHVTSETHQCDGVSPQRRPPRLPSGRVSASRAEDPGFESRLHLDFSGV